MTYSSLMQNFVRLSLTSAALTAAVLPAPFAAAQGGGPYTVVETGQRFGKLQDAINAIDAGVGTIRIAPGRHADCGVQPRGDIRYIAEVPGQSVFDGVTCEGKAAFVLRGRSSVVEGMVFTNMRVDDGNGAGIRLERGNLKVLQTWFRDSEQGILTAEDPASTIEIDKSTFTRLGRCDRGLSCAHSIYTARYGAVTITRSRFEAGRGGHYVKTHALRVGILNNSFDDTAGRTTNYMIDLSVGSTGRIASNWFVQGRDKENYTAMIAIAPEARENSSDGLAIEGNDARFAPGAAKDTFFVVDWQGGAIRLGQNALGPGLQRYQRR
jgi:hypothetical protein